MKQRNNIAAFLVGLFLLMLAPCAVEAATYYVATTGDDANPGSETAPWRTVKFAVSKMVAGDTTYVRGGVYKERSFIFSKSGTASAPIKLIGYQGEFPVLQGDGSYSSGIKFGKGVGWIVLEGFEITNYQAAVNFNNANIHDVVIRRNHMHHNTPVPNAPMVNKAARHGFTMVGNGARLLVDRNRFSYNGNFHECFQNRNTAHCNQDHGMYVHGPDWVVTNNVFDHILGYGIQVSDRNKGVTENWIIANNTFANHLNRGGIVLEGHAFRNMRIENNIFYENNVEGINSASGQGVHFSYASGSSGTVIRNNISYAVKAKGPRVFITSTGRDAVGSGVVAGRQYTLSGNIVNTADPNMVNPTGGDFHLQAGSPAIDAGLSLSQVTWDHQGIKRPAGASFDIGAYEFCPPSVVCEQGSPPPNPVGDGVPPATPRPPSTYDPSASLCPL